MSFAQVYGSMICAAVAIIGCSEGGDASDELVAATASAVELGDTELGTASLLRSIASDLTTPATAAQARCTAIAIAAPTPGAIVPVGQPVTLAATTSCRAGDHAEHQFWVRLRPLPFWFPVTGFRTGPASFALPVQGGWEITAVVRSIGSHAPFEAVAAPVTVTATLGPIAVDDALAVDEDSPGTVDVISNDRNPRGGALVTTIIGPPVAGTATITGGIVRYTPAADHHGDDSIRYRITDRRGRSSSANLRVTVRSVNDAPVAEPDVLSVDQGGTGSLDVARNDRDVDGDPLTVIAVSAPGHGTVTFAGAVVSYTPARDYSGQDAFTYTISDSQGGTASAEVAVGVVAGGGGNTAPVGVDDVLSLAEDTEAGLDVLANDADPDGDPLTVVAFDPPAHGAVTLVAGVASYRSAPDFFGDDAFSYTLQDPGGLTATATVRITVLPVNDLPVASDDVASLAEDAAVVIDVVGNDRDGDGDALTVTSVTPPAHGTAAIVSGHAVRYRPAADYHGVDAFSYTVADPSGALASATVTLAIASINDPPVAVDDAATLDEDTSATIDVVASDRDVDGDPLAITEISQPAHGRAELVDARRVRYTPDANFHGGDSFRYTIGDPGGAVATASVALTLVAVNDPPVAVADAASLDEDTAIELDLVANDRDLDGDLLAITSVTQPAHGTATVIDGHHVRYAPAANYHGPDGFGYTIADASGAVASALVTIAVVGVNDAPAAVGDAARVDEDATLTLDVVANDLDVDGDPLAIIGLTQPAHGLATLIDGHRVLYAPAPDYHGPDALSYTISDGNGGQATGELAIEVIGVNDAPVAVDDAGQLAEDTALAIDVAANDRDGDGDPLAITGVTPPEHGTATVIDVHHVLYTPAADYHGPDRFSYTIGDGNGGEAIAGVTLEVAPVNDPPVAVADAASLAEDAAATVDVVANDRDVDGDVLTVSSVSSPAHGAAVIVDGHQVRYTPAAHYHGPDALQYTIQDGAGGQAVATLTLDVISVNDPPVAADLAINSFDDTSVLITLVATDVDGDAVTFSIASPPGHGSLGPLAGDRVTYTPAPGFVGADGFSYVAHDGSASSTAATVAVTVNRSVCGNGIAEGREECDDGDLVGGDGCEASCELSCGAGTGADRASVDPVSGHCFAAYDGLRHSYQDAAALCTGFGGHLPTITSAGEDAAALAAVHLGDRPWLGGDDVAIEGGFTWGTGEPFASYRNFAAGKPDNAGDADCLRLDDAGTWSDAACASDAATLCEFELATATPAFATGGSGTRGVVVVDVNGDGYPDVVATHPTSGSVGVLLGNGAGGLVLGATVAAGAAPSAIAAADFDGDGRPDLAVVSATANTVTLLRGSATGGFTAAGTLAIAAGASALATADFDQDGRIDLAIAATGVVQVLGGDGVAGFAPLASIAITGAPAGLAAGDLDGDGRADLAITTSTTVALARSVGPGTFAPAVVLVSVAGSLGVIAADLDRDGRLDLAVAGSAGLSVWFGGPAGFAAPLAVPVAGAPGLTAAGDFDGDGEIDLVAATGGTVALLHGSGRTFTALGPPIATGGTGASALAVAGLNRDSAHDLVVANATSSTAGVLLGGPGGFAGARTLGFGTAPASTIAADWNADGRTDLAVVDPGTSTVGVFLQTASGALAPSATIALLANSGATFGAAADFDADGKLDLAIVNVNFSSVSVALGAGDGTFGAPINSGVARSPRRLAVADFNGDGRPDLAIPAAIGNAVTLLVNAGGGRFGRLPDLAVTGAPSAVVVGDWNRDGRSDLAVATAGEASVKVLLGRGGAAFEPASAVAVAAGGQAIAAGDLDGDGQLDLVVTTTATGGINVVRGTGTGAFGPPTAIATGAQPSSVAIADLDGDGRPDVVVGNAGAADVTVLHNAGAGALSAFSVATGVASGFVTLADLDRDGHLDITVASPNPFVITLAARR
jgi:cysteine-rich repeat protein